MRFVNGQGNFDILRMLFFGRFTPSFVGLSMMCYTEEKANSTCFGDFQLRGLIGK